MVFYIMYLSLEDGTSKPTSLHLEQYLSEYICRKNIFWFSYKINKESINLIVDTIHLVIIR